jgi:hypothetical protein
LTRLQKDVKRVVKLLEKAADIAAKHELTDACGGFVDSQVAVIAAELFYKYVEEQ